MSGFGIIPDLGIPDLGVFTVLTVRVASNMLSVLTSVPIYGFTHLRNQSETSHHYSNSAISRRVIGSTRG